MIGDIVKKYLNSNDNEYDESEYIEPEYTTEVEIEDDD